MDEASSLKERIRLTAAALKEQDVLSQRDLEGAGLLPTSGNANPYVPWGDPQIPYECFCREIIYSDSVHSHEGDEPTQFDLQLEQAKKEERMELQTKLSIDEVVELAVNFFHENAVKHYLEDHGEEFRGAGRAYEAGDAVRAAMEQLGGIDNGQSEYDEFAPNWWPEAEERVRAAIPDCDQVIIRRQELGYRP